MSILDALHAQEAREEVMKRIVDTPAQAAGVVRRALERGRLVEMVVTDDRGGNGGIHVHITETKA